MPTFDKKMRPQDDFFGYVNNNWLKSNPIPPNESSWGTFNALRNKSSVAIDKIVNELKNTSDDTLAHDQKLIKTFFSTALSYSNYTNNHLKILNTELQKIRSISDKSELSRYLGHAHRYDFESFWSIYISVDDKNSQIQVLRIHQGGLCLPNRDYYMDDTTLMKRVRKGYSAYFEAVHKLMPKHSPDNWNAIFQIETKLAKASWTEIELRDVEKNYTRLSIKELQSRFSKFDWLEYFKALGWKKPTDNIIIDQPSFVDAVLDIFDNHSLDEIKQYLSWHVVNNLLSWIDKTATNIKFDFYGKIINGKTEINPLWKRAVIQVDDLAIGEILGKEYARRYFPESSKKAVLEMVEEIRFAYHKRIDNVTWMKINTKKRAHKKLDNIKVLIGYPSTWRNLSKLSLVNDNHLANILSARGFDTDFVMAKIGKKPDPKEWQMNAQTVNAYHDPNQLAICFPAAILQPPFYSPNVSYATNLGGIGAIIGHELTHGFDDQGAEFDEFGNLNQWQTKSEQKLFNKMAKNIVRQADTFEVLPGIFLKGKLILGEVLADIGGLDLAIEALRIKTGQKNIYKYLRELFVNSASSYCEAQREEDLIRESKTDPHPPARYRVNCVVTHIDAFYVAYNVTSNDKLYLPPDKRVHIW
jgi:predicted metalloendopeptidase